LSIPISDKDDLGSIRSKIDARLHETRDRTSRGRKSSYDRTDSKRRPRNNSISKAHAKSSPRPSYSRQNSSSSSRLSSGSSSGNRTYIRPSKTHVTVTRKQPSMMMQGVKTNKATGKRSKSSNKRTPRRNTMSRSPTRATSTMTQRPSSSRGKRNGFGFSTKINLSIAKKLDAESSRSPPRSSKLRGSHSSRPKAQVQMNGWMSSHERRNSVSEAWSPGKKFVTAIRSPRASDLRMQASKYEANDRGPYVGNLQMTYTPRPTMEARHLAEIGKPDFKTKFNVPRNSPEIKMDGSRNVVLSASERVQRIRSVSGEKFDENASVDMSRIRQLATKPWFAEDSPGTYAKNPNKNAAPFTTSFRTPRPDDLRKEASRDHANDRGVYIGNIRNIPPSDIQRKIESARSLKSPTAADGFGMRNLEQNFRVYFSLPDSSRGIDGEKTEPLSASDRRIKSSAGDDIWMTSPMSREASDNPATRKSSRWELDDI